MIRALPLFLLSAPALAGDWTAWGGTPERNMVAVEKKVSVSFEPGEVDRETEQVDLSTASGVRWVAKLGSQTYGNPTVADGRVYVGTNNAMERRPGVTGDYSLVQAFSEADGSLLWQLSVPKLGSGKVNDWEYLGICSSPTVVGEAVYVVTNRGEVVALDVHGLKDGNDGAFTDEGAYIAGPGKPPIELDPAIDADILWRYDMPEELGVFPHNITSSSVLVVGDRLFVTTSNGVDWSHIDLPSPFSPALIALDRHTGALVAEEVAGISERTLHANWSSPTLAPALGDRKEQVIFGAGDGFLYGFGVEPVDDDGLPVLDELWKVDGNPEHYRVKDGAPIPYATFGGPSEFIGTPVYVDGVVYAAIGQDPEHGPGVGRLAAYQVGASGEGAGKQLWAYDSIQRSLSTVAVAKGVVYAADYDGRLHAVDASSGAGLWVHDTRSHIWGSPYVVGNYVLLGNEDGILTVYKAGKKLKIVREIEFPAPIYATPVLANGVLYLATQTHLYAVDGR